MKYLMAVLIVGFTISTHAQSTWGDIHAMFQAKCAVACHNAGNLSGNMNLSGTPAQVYAEIVNVSPVNPAALAKGQKRIAPGYPERSFLLRKCNNGWDPYYEPLSVAEGNPMPNGMTPLSDVELEKLRQWILHGAPATGTVVADSTIQDFYNGEGITRQQAPQAPAAGTGFQVKLGPWLLEPLTEVEYFKKHDILTGDSIEVNRIEILMNTQSHHYLIYKFSQGAAGFFPEGFRDVNTAPSGSATTLVSGAQYSRDFILPQGTAYFWEPGTVLDLNYHILNYSTDSILMAEAWFNVYTQPTGTALAQMYSILVPYSHSGNPSIFFIPPDGQNKVFTEAVYTPGTQDQANIWMLSTHTHKWGVDYDIYRRNPNGSKGDQLYEGFYDRDYVFNQGYYDWAHPAIREFDPLENVNLSDGLIQEATFRNMGQDTVYFGLTTADEMMLIAVQYTLNWTPVPGYEEFPDQVLEAALLPNPSHGHSRVRVNIKEHTTVQIKVFDLTGRLVADLPEESAVPGWHEVGLDADLFDAAGVYMVQVETGAGRAVLKMVVEK